MTFMLISLSNITKTYMMGDVEVKALSGVDFTVKSGEFASIMGPSGSGKSTLMNILGCLDSASSGDYYLAGKEVSGMSDSGLAQVRNKHIGFVFQSFNLLPKLTALQNVALPMVYAGVGRKERIRTAEEALEMVGLTDRMNHKPNEMSGGQKQRVAIARALVNKPDLILADEPTGNLDSHSGEDIMTIFRNLHKQGRTILLVTHEKEVAENADRIVYIRDGKIIKDEKVANN